MNRKILLLTVLIISIGIVSFSFNYNKLSHCTFVSALNYPGGGASNTGGGLTGASWDNSGRTCSNCHGGGSFNPTTTLTLLSGSSPVTQYTPGAAYTLQMKITAASGSPKYSFCVMAAKATGNVNVNTWGTMPTGTANHTVGGRNYIEQTSARTASATTPTSSYTLNLPWTAPAVGSGSVKFYAEGMAVNGTGGTGGDSPAPSVNITVTESTTTPVIFSAVSAQKSTSGVKISWATEVEISTDYFSIENSTDGIHFTSLGKVTAKNSNTRTAYSFNQTYPKAGKNFYRIVAVDMSTEKVNSKIVELNLDETKYITLSPNPTKNFITLQSSNILGSLYKITNNAGQKVLSGKLLSNKIDVDGLQPGVYFISIFDETGNKQVIKFIKN